MKTTLKLIASAVSLCVAAPGAYAISSDQAAANLKGALEFDHFAQKNYAAALRTERVSNVDMMNVMHQFGTGSPQAVAAAQTHQDAFDVIGQRRNEVKLAQTQLQAARNAFKDGSIAPTAIPVAPMPQPAMTPSLPVQAVPPKLQTYSTPQPLIAPPDPVKPVPPKLATYSTPQPLIAPPDPVKTVPPKLATYSTPQPLIAPPDPVKAVPPKLATYSTPQPMNVPPVPVQLTPAYETKTTQPILSVEPAAGDIPSPQPLPTSTVQVVNLQTPATTLVKGTPDNTVINPQTVDTHTVTLANTQTTPLTVTSGVTDPQPSASVPTKKTTSPRQTAGNSYTVNVVSEVNSYYVDQTNRSQVNTNGQRIASNSQRIETNGQRIENNGQRITGNSQRIDNNSQRISGNSQRIDSNSQRISGNSQRIDSNSQRITRNSQSIERNAKEIDDTREDLKRGLNNAAAMSSLHYHSDNSWALSTGTANGDGAALAAGLQKGITPHVAVNMQASSSFDNGWMAGAGISGDF